MGHLIFYFHEIDGETAAKDNNYNAPYKA